MNRLDSTTLVSGQIAPEDMAMIAALGVTMIVNNRPDGEEPGQPRSAEIREAAEAAGIDYRHIPVAGAGISGDQVQAMAQALESRSGKVLAFCRSGTRSTYLWALARAQAGDDLESIEGAAAAAGYNLAPVLPYLRR